MSQYEKDTKPVYKRLPRSIWALGFVSMFMDISSEMVHALLPVFLVSVLGASTITVGLIEGVGEATASISKLFSGWLSDRLCKRKLLTVVGYGLGALSKPLFAFAPSASWIFLARFSDRIGKGIRGAPRDALVGDLAPDGLRGAAFGLRQSLDTVGAFIGPLLAIALMAALANDFRRVFLLAVIPGLIAVAILVFCVREPERTIDQSGKKGAIRRFEFRHLSKPFWAVLVIGTILTLARFSEAFLLLRAEDAGLSLALIPLVLVVMNVFYAASAYPIGALSDRMSRHALLAAGFLVLIAADIVLATASSLWAVMLGVVLWGLHLGMTQGLIATLISEATTPGLRGTAFGIFHFATGVALLMASLVAGILWQGLGPAATFYAGAMFTAVGLAGMAVIFRGQQR